MATKQIFDGRFTRLFADEVYIDGTLTFALSSNSNGKVYVIDATNMELIETLQTGVAKLFLSALAVLAL